MSAKLQTAPTNTRPTRRSRTVSTAVDDGDGIPWRKAPLTAAAIFEAIRQLGGRPTPPDLRRHLQLRPPTYGQPDSLIVFLETMRQRRELIVQWDGGNARYRVADRARA